MSGVYLHMKHGKEDMKYFRGSLVIYEGFSTWPITYENLGAW